MQWRRILLTDRTTSTQNVTSWVLDGATTEPSLCSCRVIPINDRFWSSTRAKEWHFNVQVTIGSGRKVRAQGSATYQERKDLQASSFQYEDGNIKIFCEAIGNHISSGTT